MTPWHSLPFFHWHGAFPFSGASMWKLEGISLMPWEMYSGTRIHSANPIIQTADWNSFFFLFFFPPVWMILAKRAWNETMGGSCFLFLRVAACHQHWVEQRGRLECYSPAAHPCSLSSGISHCLVKARASLCFQRHHFWASNFSSKETKLKQCVAVWGRDIPWLNPTVRRKLKVANVST